MAEQDDVIRDLAAILVAAANYEQSVFTYADRLTSRLGLGEDDDRATAGEALRKALGALAITGQDLATLRQIVADAIDYRREHEDADCSGCDSGDCETAREDGEQMTAYLEFRDRLGLGGAG
jgi:hypothetical protein